ncbi:hypothetical protein [Mesorhizobium sangaii]|uniref:Uncharacterized protein n=1 Tax=Mesorhizobium sangaii TaxID=505389 RepID=A0A841PMJ2_9HYPH|nr:hypothetical protein [Mesorhizobium sangaii]MBB6411890.1 hypothetical protein [Mesorhizobium sangaii]
MAENAEGNLHRKRFREAALAHSVDHEGQRPKAFALAKEIGDKVRIEEITPKGADCDKINHANE